MILLQAMMGPALGLGLLFAAGFAVVYVGLWLRRLVVGFVDGYRGRAARPPLLSAGKIVLLSAAVGLLLCAWLPYHLDPLLN